MNVIEYTFGNNAAHNAIDLVNALRHAGLNDFHIACGCPECDSSVQSGHFACEVSDEAMIQFERRGLATRYYEGSGWKWALSMKAQKEARRQATELGISL